MKRLPYTAEEATSDCTSPATCQHRWRAYFDDAEPRFPWSVIAPHAAELLDGDSDASCVEGGSFATQAEAIEAAHSLTPADFQPRRFVPFDAMTDAEQIEHLVVMHAYGADCIGEDLGDMTPAEWFAASTSRRSRETSWHAFDREDPDVLPDRLHHTHGLPTGVHVA